MPTVIHHGRADSRFENGLERGEVAGSGGINQTLAGSGVTEEGPDEVHFCRIEFSYGLLR